MSTTAPAPASFAASPSRDRIFYSGMAIALALTTFVGFAPTFYLRALFDGPVSVTGAASLSPLAQLHGAVFTAWVVLFVVQTSLVASHRVAVHRRLGIAGVVLAIAMVAIGFVTAVKAAIRGAAPPNVDPLAFLIVPLVDMLLFALFVAAAVYWRREKETHKRLMLMAYISIIVAAVARIPGVISLGPLGFFGLTFIFVIAGMAYDRLARGRIHPVYIWGGLVFLVSVPARLAFSATGAWRKVAETLAGMMS